MTATGSPRCRHPHPTRLAAGTARWPVYTPAAADLGVRAVFAFPLQVGAARLGVLEIFRVRPGRLSGDELRQALMFAEVALTTLLDGQESAPPGAVAEGWREGSNAGPGCSRARAW